MKLLCWVFGRSQIGMAVQERVSLKEMGGCFSASSLAVVKYRGGGNP